MNYPILYSFRRCPYAMRARMALNLANIRCEIREVSLKNKPQSMIKLSPKATVPVLYVNNKVIDDSFPYYFSGLWADPSRAQQIIVRLDTMDNATVDEMKSIQLDYTSLFAKEITPYFYTIDVKEENDKITVSTENEINYLNENAKLKIKEIQETLKLNIENVNESF